MAENRFSQHLFVRVTPGVKAAVDEAAARKGISQVHWARAVITAALRAEGIDLADAQYALVRDGKIVGGPSFNPARDHRGGEWLPIENEDSEPFDKALHWRLKPLPLRIDGDRVVREYPVVLKGQEHA
jgi:hypothetical protein